MQVTKQEFEERVKALMYPEVHKIALRLKENRSWVVFPTSSRFNEKGIELRDDRPYAPSQQFYWSEFDYICTTQSYHDGYMFYCEGRRIILV